MTRCSRFDEAVTVDIREPPAPARPVSRKRRPRLPDSSGGAADREGTPTSPGTPLDPPFPPPSRSAGADTSVLRAVLGDRPVFRAPGAREILDSMRIAPCDTSRSIRGYRLDAVCQRPPAGSLIAAFPSGKRGVHGPPEADSAPPRLQERGCVRPSPRPRCDPRATRPRPGEAMERPGSGRCRCGRADRPPPQSRESPGPGSRPLGPARPGNPEAHAPPRRGYRRRSASESARATSSHCSAERL